MDQLGIHRVMGQRAQIGRSIRRIAAWVVLFIPLSSGAAIPVGPAASVDDFHQTLLNAMRSGSNFTGRADVLRDAVAELFDINTISSISLGRTWRSLDAASRAEFSGLLESLIVATYASRFATFDGQSFQTLDDRAASRGWVVKTELTLASGERVALDYYFRDAGVFNVVADGVSDLSLRRADYNSIVKSEGFAALLAHLRRSIADYAGHEE